MLQSKGKQYKEGCAYDMDHQGVPYIRLSIFDWTMTTGLGFQTIFTLTSGNSA